MNGASPRYDFPHRVRDVGGAERELRRLERSMSVAYDRRDKFALDYLERRHKRASRALATLRWHTQQAGEPVMADTGQRPEPSPAPLAAPAAAGANERNVR